jgi:hypothetical protein
MTLKTRDSTHVSPEDIVPFSLEETQLFNAAHADLWDLWNGSSEFVEIQTFVSQRSTRGTLDSVRLAEEDQEQGQGA